MNTLETISKRVSIRSFKNKQISEDELNKILKAGMSAPIASAKYDSMHITVVQNEKILKEIMDATSDFVSKIFNQRKNMDFGAKTLIIISGTSQMMPGIEYANAGCIIENMLLAATSLGIDNLVWGGAAAVVGQNDELKKLAGIPEGLKPLLCVSLGYATEKQNPKEHVISVNRI